MVSDAPRSGRSLIYDANIYCRIMVLAVQKPEEFCRAGSHWSLTELNEEVNKQAIAEGISRSSVARILKEADIRPYKMRYWLNPKIEDPDLFEEEVNQVCKAYLLHSKASDTTFYSVDEKTGIQALEFIHPSKPVKAGSPEKIEFEYKRHGTLCLIPKHCSWLNQVEIWFGILSRKLLKRSSFTTIEVLETKLCTFIEYFHRHLAKPYRWTYQGKALEKRARNYEMGYVSIFKSLCYVSISLMT